MSNRHFSIVEYSIGGLKKYKILCKSDDKKGKTGNKNSKTTSKFVSGYEDEAAAEIDIDRLKEHFLSG